jgi:inner membrane protein
MEPVEHFLMGAALSRAGFNRTTGYATLVMTLAAEAPDLDIVYGLRGPVAGFEHHRGWTHTLIATPIVAAAVVAVVWGMARIVKRKTAVPVHWGRLLLLGWIAALSHIGLDWMNNYGVRPLWPFSPKWFEGDLLFILEPVMLGVLTLAMIIPWLLSLADREMGARRVVFRGQHWAWFALSVIAVMLSIRGVEHHRALDLMQQREWAAGGVKRMQASPLPVTPFSWAGVVDTGDKYQSARLDTWDGTVHTDAHEDIFYKPALTPAMRAAEGSWLGRVYMNWSQWPLVTELSPTGDPAFATYTPVTPVEFRDMRFDYSGFDHLLGGTMRGAFRARSQGGRSPLGAEVLVGPDNSIVEMKMGNKSQK